MYQARRLMRVSFLLASAAKAAVAAPKPAVTIEWSPGPLVPAFELRLRGLVRRFELPGSGSKPVRVTVFADIGTLAASTRDSRFAVIDVSSSRVELRVSADAPAEPDLLAPAVAAAMFASAHPESGRNPVLLAAYGAVLAGSWWGRDVSSFVLLLDRAGAGDQGAPLPEDRPDLLRIGEVASVLGALNARDLGQARRCVSSGTMGSDLWTKFRLVASKCRLEPVRRRRLRERPYRGISWAMSNSVSGSYLGREAPAALDRLRQDGADAVSIMPFAFQKRPESPEIHQIRTDPHGETDEAVFRAIELVHARGMAALVKPQIWLPRSFPGEIDFMNEDDWRRWFASYRRFALREAIVAEAARADVFDVGVELTKTERRVDDWRRTILALRAATGAPLVYSCNWASGAVSVPFWDAVDAIGVDLYDPLSKNPAASDEDLEKGARRLLAGVSGVAAGASRPYLLTEVGYPSISAAWLSPYEEDVARPFSAEDQSRCARALLRAAAGSPGLAGLFWWKAFSNGRPAGADEKSFNLVGRPVEAVLKEAFSRFR